ncbi:uncharacterized protein Fot_24438 [Forsythia ovata]|uniref:Uncharacterized protein n=1 Tax=Forsythia ovata TaxID=205694 RepID=A0ABD1U669_9LAMI
MKTINEIYMSTTRKCTYSNDTISDDKISSLLVLYSRDDNEISKQFLCRRQETPVTLRSSSPSASAPSNSGEGGVHLCRVQAFRRRRGSSVDPPEILISRSESLRPGVKTLSPLREGPDPNGSEGGDPMNEKWGH